MRLMISALVVFALIFCSACAKQEAPPADQAPAAADAPQDTTDQIATEDFEAGEAETMIEVDDTAADEDDTSD